MKKIINIGKLALLSAVLLTLFSCSNIQANAQVQTSKFSIVEKNDTINFILISKDTTIEKPTILFSQGSLPRPLIIEEVSGDYAGQTYIPAFNFDYITIAEKYNIILISHPHTPVHAKNAALTNQSLYVPDISKPDELCPLYWEDNVLENYISRGNAVIAFLKQQNWVDSEKLILLGHSQGGNVATHLASENPDILALGYFGCMPFGRHAGYIVQALSNKEQSHEEIYNNISTIEKRWQNICQSPIEETDASPIGDSPATWTSFSNIYVDKMAALPMPVYIAFGTKDAMTQLANLLPVYFEIAKKTDYKMRRFINCGHNFEEIAEDGTPNYEKMHWNTAVNEFLLWCEEL